MPNPDPGDVRVRFCPSPTGTVHVGLIRTALFNWAFARHHGGAFVFRIEDTDASRDSEASYRHLLDSLRWLGLDWDEGPEIGGPYAPYRQSERDGIYSDVAARLLASGVAYESYSRTDEIEARHRAAGRDPKLGYDNFDRELSAEQVAAFRADDRAPVIRLRMPDHDLVWDDLVRGEVRFAVGSVPDFVIVRANGIPLYPFVNPVDDALMGITHVLRGEDLLPSTPRQLALYEALSHVGIGAGAPRFGHLPYVTGEGSKKLSKRDPESSLDLYRERGFLPEGLLNYLALLGWSIADDRDIFSMQEMVAAFDIGKVSANPARFDVRKAEAINATHLRALPPDEFLERVRPYLVRAGVLSEAPTAADLETLRGAAPLVQERMNVLSEAAGLLRFLFIAENDFSIEPDSAAKVLDDSAGPILDAAAATLAAMPNWLAAEIEVALKTSLVEELGIKPRKAFAPIRVAVCGRTVSPPLYESLELLGRERSLGRLRAAAEGLRQ